MKGGPPLSTSPLCISKSNMAAVCCRQTFWSARPYLSNRWGWSSIKIATRVDLMKLWIFLFVTEVAPAAAAAAAAGSPEGQIVKTPVSWSSESRDHWEGVSIGFHRWGSQLRNRKVWQGQAKVTYWLLIDLKSKYCRFTMKPRFCGFKSWAIVSELSDLMSRSCKGRILTSGWP